MTYNLKTLLDQASKVRSNFEELLQQFVEIPTVSSDPERLAELQRCADLAAQTIRGLGGDAEIFQNAAGIPFVRGSFISNPRHPSVAVYNHLDVIPASRETEPWRTDPFVFTRHGDRYFARGTTDDKGPALTALFAARMARDLNIPLNIHFLWELQEEIGSPDFDSLVSKAAGEMKIGSVVVSDTMWLTRQRPTITAGLRGFLGMRFILETAETDQHSGDVGGAARNPIGELMGMITGIYDPKTGKVKIPGFYDDVVKPTPSELKDFQSSGFTAAWFKKTYSLKSMRTQDSLEIMKRIWAMPTFEIHGVSGGYQGPGIKSIVPPKAEVKASFRLAPGQKPQRIAKLVKNFVKKNYPDVQVVVMAGSEAYLTESKGPLADAARKAIRFAFGKDPVFVREGGSIGAIITMQKILKCPVMFLGLSLPEHGYHAPNENFDWHQASKGMAAFVSYFDQLSGIP